MMRTLILALASTQLSYGAYLESGAKFFLRAKSDGENNGLVLKSDGSENGKFE